MITVIEPERLEIAPPRLTAEERGAIISPEVETFSTEHGKVDVVWASDDAVFRMDITVPSVIDLVIALPLPAKTVYVNGEVVWRNGAFQRNGSGVYAVEALPDAMRLWCGERQTFHILASRHAA